MKVLGTVVNRASYIKYLGYDVVLNSRKRHLRVNTVPAEAKLRQQIIKVDGP